jgi:uncharacterized protein (TIGR02246 family)
MPRTKRSTLRGLGATSLVILANAAGCATTPRDDELAIRQFTRQYARSFCDGDPAGVVALMTDDFVALTPGKPPIVGKEAVEREVTSDLSELEVQRLHFDPREIVVNGTWAWTWGVSEVVMKTRKDDQVVRATGKYLWILHRQADGSWRVARDSAQAD